MSAVEFVLYGCLCVIFIAITAAVVVLVGFAIMKMMTEIREDRSKVKRGWR